VLIVDFPDDDPREAPDPNWRPPIARPQHRRDQGALAEAVEAELRALAPPMPRRARRASAARSA
jgi:hypothetical protein